MEKLVLLKNTRRIISTKRCQGEKSQKCKFFAKIVVGFKFLISIQSLPKQQSLFDFFLKA